ncbi:MAG: helix-turn-helix domain-containing protein [Phycisphaerae bacterium]|nr:helix-turn-helix domain-containing protein [Phycisphaerae bacterium]
MDVRRVEVQTYIASHSHDFGELVLILSGAATHHVHSLSHSLSAGDVFVIPENVTHEYRDLEQLSLINLFFNRELLQWPIADLTHLPGYQALFELEPRLRRRGEFQGRLRVGLDELAFANGLVKLMETELKHRNPGFRFQLTALFMQLVCFLSRCYGQVRNPETRGLIRLGTVLAYLEEHYSEAIRLPQLAKIAHMSPSTLLRTFRAALGTTPVDYLIRLRTRKAADRLREEELTVTEAALHAGFSDANYFTRQFRKTFGVSPGAFRRTPTQRAE